MLFENSVAQLFQKRLYVRYDNPNGIFYFQPEDFPGLMAIPYDFRSQMGHELKGFFYHYDGPIPGRLVVFDHGMGNGHRAYLREIEKLCRAGFLVYSYDHTGCMASGGRDINGFAQSLADLDDCIKALKREPGLGERTIAVMGHSWGGFSAMNIGALHPDITHLVAMSGFVSVERIVKQSVSGVVAAYAPAMYRLELKRSPRYARYTALESLAKTNAKVLLIHSEDDKIVYKSMHYDALVEYLSGRPNIQFLLLQGKNHNPTYTDAAVQAKNAMWKELSQAIKKKQLETPEQQKAFMARYDWWAITEQDQDVWNAIIAHLKK